MRRWLRNKIQTLGVTPVGLRPPSVTPSVTLNNNFSNLFTDISNELLILTFLMSYYTFGYNSEDGVYIISEFIILHCN